MYRPQLFLVQVPINQRQQPSPLPTPFVNPGPFTMQRPLVANPIPFYTTPIGAAPQAQAVYQGTRMGAGRGQHYPSQGQVPRALGAAPQAPYQGMGGRRYHGQLEVPSSGPSRNHPHQRFRQAEPQNQYNSLHASYRTVATVDRSSGIDPGRIEANNTGKGKRSKPYSREYLRRNNKNPTAAYELPTEFKGFKFKSLGRMMADGPTPGPSISPSPPMPTPTPTPVSESVIPTAQLEVESTGDEEVQDQPDEEGDVDTVSLGEESDAGF